MEAIKKLIGKKVVIRADRAGVFFGTLNEAESTGDKWTVELLNNRRLFYWEGACSVTQIAIDGTTKKNNCKFTQTLESSVISGVIECLPASEKAIKVIESVKTWKM